MKSEENVYNNYKEELFNENQNSEAYYGDYNIRKTKEKQNVHSTNNMKLEEGNNESEDTIFTGEEDASSHALAPIGLFSSDQPSKPNSLYIEKAFGNLNNPESCLYSKDKTNMINLYFPPKGITLRRNVNGRVIETLGMDLLGNEDNGDDIVTELVCEIKDAKFYKVDGHDEAMAPTSG